MNRALALLLVLPLGLIHAAARPPEAALESYRAELHRFRQAFGGARDLPDERFFLFGMGVRQKLLHQNGALVKAPSGEIIRRWTVPTLKNSGIVGQSENQALACSGVTKSK